MSGINREQAAAASHSSGHAIVLAGPGTGKTSTLVARHSYLRSRGVAAEAAVTVTFTQKAAEELRQRLGAHAPASAWIGTFHGVCLRLLKRFHASAGLRKSFKVLDPAAQRDILFQAGVTWDSDDGDLTDIIGRWKDSMMSPGEAAAEATRKGNSVLRDAAEHYQTYQDELARRGDLDFADLVVKALETVRAPGQAKEYVTARLPHVLVDEFQDVNRSQVEFLQALAACGSSIWAVADDDQALYGWRGGDVRYTVSFADYFPGARTYALETNYRCDPAVIAAANAVIAGNRNRVRKMLKPSREHRKGTAVRVRGFRTEREEADWIAATLERLAKAGAPMKEIGLLFRTSSVSPAIQQALEAKGVPFTLSGAQSFWDLAEVAAVAEILVAVERGLPGRAARFRGGTDLVETMKGEKPSTAAGAVGRLVGDQPPQGTSGERAALWSDAAEAAASLAVRFDTAAAFHAHVSEMAGSAVSGDSEGVAVSTIHSAKGLEWKHVIVAGCEASLMPHHRSDDTEEERRLFYVALTRSKGSVDVTHSKQRFGRAQAPSPFLAEAARAPQGAVVWVDASAARNADNTDSRPASGHGKPAGKQDEGRPAVYRRRGGRSLIPPEDR